jgi:capsule assembly protein Wzi
MRAAGRWTAAVAGVIVAASIFTMLPGSALATYLPHERIPTDDAIYRDLERLATRYASSARFLSSRPLRRKEALAYLVQLGADHPGAAVDPAYRRALRGLDPEAPGGVHPLVSADGDDGERIELSPYASALYAEDPRYHPEINRDYRVGLVMAGQLDTNSVFLADFYEGTASQGGRGTPDFGDFNSLVEGVNFNSWMNEAYASFPVSKIRVMFGHTWLRWGPGETGTLALSDAAPALDLLHFEGDMFRDFRYQQFVSLLDPGPQTYLAGHRLEWHASPRLWAGLTEIARFNGTSQAPLYLIPFVPYSFWEKRPKTGGVDPSDSSGELLRKNNVAWAVDASWVPVREWRLYGEFLLDDYSFSSDYKPDMIGYQAGLEWRREVLASRDDQRLAGEGSVASAVSKRDVALGALLEYTRVHNYTYSVYHHHDFAFEGFPLGYVLGPDVQQLVGQVSLEWGADWEIRVRGEYRRKGEGSLGNPWLKEDGEVDASAFQGVVEKEVRLGGAILYSPSRSLELSASVGASGIENRDHVPAPEESETPFALQAKVSW